MKVGEEKRIQVNPADGYGSVNRDAFLEVPKDKLPPEALKLRTILIAQDSQVRESRGVFMKSKNATVIMDFNHPMTGKTLSLDVKVSEIKTPEKSLLEKAEKGHGVVYRALTNLLSQDVSTRGILCMCVERLRARHLRLRFADISH